jgi:hypothetical protein
MSVAFSDNIPISDGSRWPAAADSEDGHWVWALSQRGEQQHSDRGITKICSASTMRLHFTTSYFLLKEVHESYLGRLRSALTRPEFPYTETP